MKIIRCCSFSLPRFCLRGVWGGLSISLLLTVSSQLAAAQTSPQSVAAPSRNTQASATANSSTAKDDERYRIGPGDVLDIRFYNRPQLSREAVRVDGHGMIRMPLVEGEIKAACLTESELATEIAAHYL